MTRLAVVVLAVMAACLQLGALPAFLSPERAPVLPLAAIVAWAVVRAPSEVWPALVATAAVLGVTSGLPVGWYLLALLPAALAVLAPPMAASGLRLWRAFPLASGGALAYGVALMLAGGEGGTLRAATGPLLLSALGTGIAALAFSVALWPLRGRRQGLFE